MLGAQAQDKPQKGSVGKAESFLSKGELDKAKEQIDLVMADPKQSVKPGSLLAKGKIYSAIALDTTGRFAKLTANPVAEAMDAFNKIFQTEKQNSVYHSLATIEVDQKLYPGAFNVGVQAFQAKSFEKAAAAFESVTAIRSADTTAYLYAMYAYYNAGENNKPKAAQLAEKLVGMNYPKSDPYIIYIDYLERAGDNAKLEAGLKQALTKFPNDKDIKNKLANFYIKTDNKPELLRVFEQMTRDNPKDAGTWMNLGILYSQTGNQEKALQTYDKVLELDPSNYAATFEAGVIYYNKATAIYREMNEMPMDNKGRFKDMAKASEMDKKAKEEFARALPYFQKAAKINPDDRQSFEILSTLYKDLNMEKEYQETKVKLDKMPK